VKQCAFTFSHLGETLSPERDGFSLKIGARRLRDNSRKLQGALLVLSLGQDSLAWAKTPSSSTVHACHNQAFETKQCFISSQAIITTNKPHNHETKPKQAEYRKKQENPSFPYLNRSYYEGV